MLLAHSLYEAIAKEKLGRVFPGVNLSDREDDWTKNYRCPNVVVFLNDTTARDCDTHWLGGPDFAIEITSPHDQTRDKLPFYEKIATRELLLIDRDPWQLELYQLHDQKLTLTATSTLAQPTLLTSAVVPLTFRLTPGPDRPLIAVAHPAANQHWTV
jgi:Uma2 family endonuclease